jgi:uncharacterized protein (TIGR02118 family)
MIKSLSLLTAKDGMTREEFRKIWLAEHAPLVHAVPGVRKYVLSFIVAEPTTANAPIQSVRVDAIAELWYDDMEAMQRAAASPEHKIVLTNGAKYLGSIKPLVTEEVTII